MRKVTLVLLALGLVVASSAFAANAVRISQVYGNGGQMYKCDYVELFNNSNAPVNIGGWSVQYGSSGGTSFGSSTYNYALIPAGATIPACGYYLITGNCSTSAGADLPVTPDLAVSVPPTWAFNFSGTAGKVGLFSDQVFNRVCADAQAVAIDIVGYGAANCYETTPAAAGVATAVLARASGGAQDTDINSSDLANQTQPWPMHNTASTPNPDCGLDFGGACCLKATPGACIFVTAGQCALPNVFLGVGVPCDFGICMEVPATKTSWGQIKTIYR
jgi:hypothetical protein